MSADRRHLLLAVLLAIAAACGGGGGGGGKDVPSPSNLHLEPGRGFSGHDTPVVITGDNFLARPTGSSLDTRHQVWLGEAELVEVQWVSAHELHATVPAGLAAGKLPLRVRNAYGREGTLADAFTIETTAGGALAVTSVALDVAEVNVGQTVTVTATVQSVGTADVTHVVPSLPPSLSATSGGAASVLDGPTPAAADGLAPGQSATFTWTVRATAAGQRDSLGAGIPLDLPVTASGDDAFSGLLVQADARAGKLVIDEPAGLTASVVAGRAAVDAGQAVTVTFSVTNGGTATANLDAPVPSASLAVAGGGSRTASCTSPSPAGATTVGAHANRAFTWTCTPSAAGVLTLSGSVTGKDANTGATLSATPASADVVAVQTAAALRAVLSIQGSPSAVNLGQSLTVNLAVSDTGTAPAHVTRVTPSGASASCSAATPDPPLPAPGGGTIQFTWTCTPNATGTLSLGATVAGTDDNTGAALAATASAVSVLVQQPASLVGVTSASLDTVDTAQAVSVTLRLVNGSSVAANIGAVAPRVDPSSTAQATCGAAAGALPIVLVGGASTTLTWSCTSSAAGRLLLGAAVTATDANNPSAAVPVTISPASVVVQTPASVAVTEFVVTPTTVETGQAAQVTLSLRNSGGADARVTIAPSASVSGASCAPAPAPAQILAGGGGVLQVAWTCTASRADVFTYGAAVSAVDVNTGIAASPPVTGVPVTVTPPPPAFSASLSADAGAVVVGGAVHLTLTVTNAAGAGPGQVTAVVPSGTSGLVSCPAAPAEGLPVTVSGGSATTFHWTCSGTGAGSATLGAAVTVSGGAQPVVAGVGLAVAVPPPAFSASFSTDAASVVVGGVVHVTLTVTNAPGAGSGQVTGVVPRGTAGVVSCPTAPTEEVPVTVAGGSSAFFHWTCSGAAAGSATLEAAVTVSGGPQPTVAGVGLAVAVPPPSFSASLSEDAGSMFVGGAVHLTLTVTNAIGAGSGQVTAVVPSGTAGVVACPAAPAEDVPVAVVGGSSTTFHWTCSGAAAGTASLGAGVTVSGGPQPAVSGVGVTVAEPPPSLTAGLAADASSVAVGGAVNLTLTVSNAAGAGAATVIGVAPQASSGAVSCSPAPVEALPATVVSGTPATFHWSCAAIGGGSADLRATVTATGVAAVSSNVVTVSVVPPAGVPVTGTLTASPATLPATGGGNATLTFTLRNPGPLAVRLPANAVTTLVDAANAAGFDCVDPVVAPQDLASGATLTSPITWSCTSRGGPVGAVTSFGARSAATDVSGADASGIVTGGSVRLQ